MMSRRIAVGIGVRARPVRLVLIVPLLVAAAGLGCAGRRNAMRPVYVGQPVTIPSADCPSGDCDGAEPGMTTPPSNSEVITPGVSSSVGPAAAADPNADTSGFGPLNETPPSARKDLPPAVTPPVTDPDKEPALEPIGGTAATVPNLNKDRLKTAKPKSTLGKASTNNGRRSTSTPKIRQTSLREQVRPFVADEDDLFQPPKADRPWKYVVLHHSASPEGSYDSIDREHRSRLGWDGCGYHFIIGNGSESSDGQIEVSQRWRNQKLGVHCRDGKNPDINEYGIGICLVGDLENTPPTARQIEAARALVAYLEDRYKIAGDHAETHAHLAMSPTACPGKFFPAEAILHRKTSPTLSHLAGGLQR